MRLLATDATRMEEVAAQAVAIGQETGADHVVVSARAHAGMRVTARAGATDTALRDAKQGLTLTLYRGAQAGTASTAALDTASIRRAATEAFAIAGLVQADADALPPDLSQMAVDTTLPDLDAPAGLDPGALRAMALEGDALLREAAVPQGVSVETVVIDVSSSEGVMALATSAGFCRGQNFSNHGIWAVALARDAGGAVNDHASSQDRRFDRLTPLDRLTALAVDRAARQLRGRAVASHRGPVLFEARVATSLIGDIVAALSGHPQQRGATFLRDTLGQGVAAAHIDLAEDPYEPFGQASGGFDREGIAGRRRAILTAGVVEGYFLGMRSARRLGMAPTGNADGPWNLWLTSRADGGSFADLCRRMGRGLVVTQMSGGATDAVTGNWTYAVSGLWIEDGVPVHAVTDVTVGGNLRDMLMGMVAVGDDVHRAGAYRTGSILIHDMQIGGAA